MFGKMVSENESVFIVFLDDLLHAKDAQRSNNNPY